MRKLYGVVVAAWLCALPGLGQSSNGSMPAAPLPSAPVAAEPAKPSFALPAATYERPTGPAPEKKYGVGTCFAPEAGLYGGENLTVPASLQGQMSSYVKLVGAQVFSDWDHSMPRSARTAWSPVRYVAVRFVVMKDGTHTPPELTVSSGKTLYDGLALDAVRSHETFPALPAGMTHPAGLCLRFGYNTEATGLDYYWQDHTNQNP